MVAKRRALAIPELTENWVKNGKMGGRKPNFCALRGLNIPENSGFYTENRHFLNDWLLLAFPSSSMSSCLSVCPFGSRGSQSLLVVIPV